MDVEVTVVFRRHWPPPEEDKVRALLEEEFDVDVTEYEEEDL